MSWNAVRAPGSWQENTGYSNYQQNWIPNNPGYNPGNWGWNNNPNFTSGTWGQNYPQGNWGQGYNQGNWGGTWSSYRQPWNTQQGWSGNPNWGPWTAPGFSGYWAPWSNNPNQGYYGQGNYGPWNYGFNNPGFGYGTAYGYGPQAGYGSNFNRGYGYGQGWGNYGQGFGNYPFEENEGEYSGVGPQNYRRSDQRIEEDVCDELTSDSYVDAHDVNVSVNNGIVTLSGTVPNRDMRRRAEEDADSVVGVSDVRNNLRIGPHAHEESGMMATQPSMTQTRTRNITR